MLDRCAGLQHTSDVLREEELPAFMRSESWEARAACRDVPARWFFPESRDDGARSIGAAKVTCARCPVRRQCLELALTVRQVRAVPGERGRPHTQRMGSDGIWGGTTPRDRRRVYNLPIEQAVELLDEQFYRGITEGRWKSVRKSEWVPLSLPEETSPRVAQRA